MTQEYLYTCKLDVIMYTQEQLMRSCTGRYEKNFNGIEQLPYENSSTMIYPCRQDAVRSEL